MKIFSSENASHLRIERTGDEAYSSFEVEVTIDIGHGQFRALNNDLQWLNIADFAAKFDDFILDRELVPRLEGTYDSFLEFSGSANSVIVAFAIGDAFCGNKTHEFLLRGSFQVSEDTLSALARDFRSLREDS